MSEHDLPDLLDRVAVRLHPGAPPLAEMLADGARARRRRAAGVVVAGAAAVAVVIGGLAFLSSGDDVGTRVGPSDVTDLAVPPGMRLVGAGKAAIAVPEDWGTNRARCGMTPDADTVFIDRVRVPMCRIARPHDIQSVEIAEGDPRFDFAADTTTEIDGETVQLQTTRCEDQSSRGENTPRLLCSATTYFPDLGVWFRAESSSQPEATARKQVEETLSHVTMLDRQVAVPGHEQISTTVRDGAAEKYLDRLRGAGLEAEVVTVKRTGVQEGYILDIDPAPGTVLEPGDSVTVKAVNFAGETSGDGLGATDTVPDGYRLVSSGRAAIEVPEGWGTNLNRCGLTPDDDTVIDGAAVLNRCASTRPVDVLSVQVGGAEAPKGFRADQRTDIKGERAEIHATRCAEQSWPGSETPRICFGTVWFPDLGVWFRAESSSSPESTARADVEEILSHVTVLDGQG